MVLSTFFFSYHISTMERRLSYYHHQQQHQRQLRLFIVVVLLFLIGSSSVSSSSSSSSITNNLPIDKIHHYCQHNNKYDEQQQQHDPLRHRSCIQSVIYNFSRGGASTGTVGSPTRFQKKNQMNWAIRRQRRRWGFWNSNKKMDQNSLISLHDIFPTTTDSSSIEELENKDVTTFEEDDTQPQTTTTTTTTTIPNQSITNVNTIDLAFENIRMVLVKQKKKSSTNNNKNDSSTSTTEKILLDGNIRGRAYPGRMLAIMGPSGAGKSSLLHALAGRVKYNKQLQLSGQRYVNGIPILNHNHQHHNPMNHNNNNKKNHENNLLSSNMAFIEQEVNLFPYLTVKETLQFRVELKLRTTKNWEQQYQHLLSTSPSPSTSSSIISKKQKSKKLNKKHIIRDHIVNELLQQLSLENVQDTIVGDNNNKKVRGISGGERKRLSIALELVDSPMILFLDEPTSGLDSTSARIMIQNLQRLARVYKKTIVAVIHQPSQYIFYQFDDVLLLGEGGQQLYYGPGKSVIRTYLQTHTGIVPDPPDIGTAEYILDCITSTAPLVVNRFTHEMETNEQIIERIQKLLVLSRTVPLDLGISPNIKIQLTQRQQQDEFVMVGGKSSEQVLPTKSTILKSKLYHLLYSKQQHNNQQIQQNQQSIDLMKSSSKSVVFDHSTVNVLQQFRLLYFRSVRGMIRGKGTILLKVIQQITTALIYSAIYHPLGTNQASIMDRFGLLSLLVIGSTNLALAQTIRSFPKEKNIVSQELAIKLYNTFPYFIGKALSELPVSGFLNTMFGTIVYYGTKLNQNSHTKYVTFVSLLLLQGVVAESAGLFIGSISPTSDIALALFPAVNVLSIIFDGKNISEENTPKPLRWLSKIGLIRWGYEGLCMNEFTGLKFDTNGSGVRRQPNPLRTGEEALVRFNLGTRTIRDLVKNQITLTSTFWFLSYIGLTCSKQKFQMMILPTTNVTTVP